MIRALLLGLGLVTFGASLALAQEESSPDPPRAYDFDDSNEYPEFPEQPDDLPFERMDIVFDQVSRLRTRFVEPRVPFEFYVLAHHSRVAVRGFEMKVNIDPRITILDREFVGMNVATNPDEFIVGIKPKFCLAGDTVVLVRYQAILTEEGLTDLTLGLAPASKSSFEPPVPGYLLCVDYTDLREYDFCETCAVINPANVQPDPIETNEPEKPSFLKPVRGRN